MMLRTIFLLAALGAASFAGVAQAPASPATAPDPNAFATAFHMSRDTGLRPHDCMVRARHLEQRFSARETLGEARRAEALRHAESGSHGLGVGGGQPLESPQ